MEKAPFTDTPFRGETLSDRINMRLEVLRGETLGEINKLFKDKVQLAEQLEDAEVQIHFRRGFMFAFEKFQQVCKEIQDADKVEAIREKRLAERAAKAAGDDGKGTVDQAQGVLP